MSRFLSRRSLLASASSIGTLSAAGCAPSGPPVRGQNPRTLACSTESAPGPISVPRTGMHLVTLGTKGGPTVRTDRVQPSNVLTVDGAVYVIDCGLGVTRQLVLAGIELADIRAAFITHHHSDHNLEFGNLIYSAWNANLTTAITFCAPPPLRKMAGAFVELNQTDIDIRVADQGLPDFEPLLDAQEFNEPGVIYRDERVRVTAARNTHPPLKQTYALRFDTDYGSVVFSGDTTPDERVTQLARGADWLVHEVLHLPSLEELLESQPTETTLKDHLLASHTTNEQVSWVAKKADVGNLVLSHLVFFGDVSEQQWEADSRGDWDGNIVIARDLGKVF